MLTKYLFFLSSIIGLVILLGLLMKDRWNLVAPFFFNPTTFSRIAPAYYDRDIEDYNIQKKANEGKDENLLRRNKVRGRIIFSLKVVGIMLVYSCISFWLFKRAGMTLTSNDICVLQALAILLILWALIGKSGYEVQTIKGMTVPEHINDLWFRTLNVLSGYLFIFCYLDGWKSK